MFLVVKLCLKAEKVFAFGSSSSDGIYYLLEYCMRANEKIYEICQDEHKNGAFHFYLNRSPPSPPVEGILPYKAC